MTAWSIAKQYGALLVRYQYQALALVLLYKITIEATYGLLFGDFWEHSAVVHQLLNNPLHPGHPLFASHDPHIFVSPYAYLVAGFASLFKLTSIDALIIFGIINFCFFIHALKFFITALTGNRNKFATNNFAFLALLLILFLWGSAPWGYSGFFYLTNISLVLPYPSTFAAILTLYAMGIGFRLNPGNQLKVLATLFFLAIIVLLSHPLTFIPLALCLLIQSLTQGWGWGHFFKTILVLLGVVGLALQWPFYSLLALLTGAGDVFHHSNSDMYNHVLRRTWPLLVMAPAALWAVKEARGRVILFTILGLVLVYVYGHFTQKYSFGRVISIIILLTQILIAIGLVRGWARISQSLTDLHAFAPVLSVLVLIGVASPWFVPIFTRSLTVANNFVSGRSLSTQQLYGNLVFVERIVQPNDLVLSDIETSWLVPSFGGKIIASLHPIAFVPDHNVRTAALMQFFNSNSTQDERDDIQKKYQPKYLLLNKLTVRDWRILSSHYSQSSKGELVYENNQFQLILLKRFGA